MNSKNKDFILSLLCGFLSGIFLLIIIKNPYATEFQGLVKYGSLLWLFPIIFAVLFFVAILTARTIFKKLVFIMQLGKFAESGVLNTLIDLGVLNLLLWYFGATSEFWIAVMNIFAFAIATINSYFWNKFWTFEGRVGVRSGEFATFFIVSSIGIAINTGMFYLGLRFLGPLLGLSLGTRVDAVKILATFISMIWNFVGYKFIVFKR